jgi:plasmid stabilization system protein ParE
VNVRILEEAASEFADAVARYESIESGLGVRLKQEIKSAVRWISDHPELPRVRPKGYRRLNLKVFPYYIAYVIHGEGVWVLAIAHSARSPEYWIRRVIP